MRYLTSLTLLLALASGVAGATPPRNVILMIADGCGYAHFLAADLYAHGEPGGLVQAAWPVQVAMSTYPAVGGYDPEKAWSDELWCKDHPTDSAAAITAMTTGAKTDNRKLTVAPDGTPLETLAAAFERAGKATGVVSTVLFAHATPAGFCVAHPERSDYEAIANLILQQSALDVVMGPGHPLYDDSGRPARPDFTYVGGAATWGALLDGRLGGDADGDAVPDPWTLVETSAQFARLATGETPRRVLGLPRVRETLQAERGGDRDAVPYAVPFNPDVPDLATMVRAALNVLDEDPDGLALLVEGGAVDWASHDGHHGRLVEEMLDFQRAVAAVSDWVTGREAWDETLVVITADHETGFLTGPRAAGEVWTEPRGRGRGVLPEMALRSGDHTHALVPLWARGPGSERLRALADATDPVRGPYLDNADLGRVLMDLAHRAVGRHAGTR